MTQLEAYSLLFTDSFVSNLVIGFQRELIFHSMSMFNSYNPFLILAVSISAFGLANSVNYVFGRVLLNIFYSSENEQNIFKNKQFLKHYSKYDIIIFILVAFPFWGSFISLLAGFFKSNFLKFLCIGCLAKACYYAYILYY